MPQQTKQQTAIAAAQAVASFMQQLANLQDQITVFLTRNTDNTYDTYWQHLPTAAINANGTQGAYDQTAGSGTVAVANGSTAITFSASQTGLTGSWLIISGDSSNGLYLIVSGSGTGWVIGSPYGGTTNGTASWGTSNPNTANPIAVPIGQPLLVAEQWVNTSLGSLTNFVAFMNGTAVGTQANTPRKFSDLLNT